MVRIRKVEIRHFRGIASLDWYPSSGINCLIGKGDSGKTTILDAIELCLGTRRSTQFSDADFTNLDSTTSITITVTLGELNPKLLNLENYLEYIKSYDKGSITPEPDANLEQVIQVRLTVDSSLEPRWYLVPNNEADEGTAKDLRWSDRNLVSPLRIGRTASYHLTWGNNSVLRRLSDANLPQGSLFADILRLVRKEFNDVRLPGLDKTLSDVTKGATEHGIDTGNAKAQLDPHSLTIGTGALALHSEKGIPLSSLGTGSTRLLLTILQKASNDIAPLLLIDELETGLEPHRIIRLLWTLGSKSDTEEPQVFMTTHSPVVVRELKASQLKIVRQSDQEHIVHSADPEAQGRLRSFPEGFLSTSIVVCEGKSEIGLLRGLDLGRCEQKQRSLLSHGVSFLEAGGTTTVFSPACFFLSLGYRVAVLRDDDVELKGEPAAKREEFLSKGGQEYCTRSGCAIEDELFDIMSDKGVCQMIKYAKDDLGEDLVNDHIRSASKGQLTIDSVREEFKHTKTISSATRSVLAKASKGGSNPWIKTIERAERVGHNVLYSELEACNQEYCVTIKKLLQWICEG